MSTLQLFTGIAIVIDDEIEDRKANIYNLLVQIKKRGIPIIKYVSLPENAMLQHFQGVSFILLDWVLQSITTDSGVPIPRTSSLTKTNERKNVEFLKALKEVCFVPVFIFTNEDPETIIKTLRAESLYDSGKQNYIFVKSKSDLTGRKKLFKTIDKWVEKTPPIYVLKEWEKEYHLAKNKLFHDFCKLSPSWPSVLWYNYEEDGADPSLELGEVISRNIVTRMAPFSFEGKYIGRRMKKDSAETRRVLEGERFIKKEELHADCISTGDVFKGSGGKIYLNIRPDCDCIVDRNDPDSKLDDVNIYLIEGEKLTSGQEKKIYNKKYGKFEEKDNHAIVFSMLMGKTYKFQFKELKIEKWFNFKDQRIGRLLPPFITSIQQRYALYLQRQGLPRIPQLILAKNKVS